MSKLWILFLCFLVSMTSAFAQSSPDLEEEIRALIALVRSSDFERAGTSASELVAAHPHVFDAHWAAFRAHFEAFRSQPEGTNSAQHLLRALQHR